MKLSCLQENISFGLNIVSRITSGSKATLPILKNILLEANKSSLTLSTTDLEIAITTKIRAKIKEQGKFTIPAQLLTNYINLLPNEVITLETINNELIIKSKEQKTKIKGISAEEFPIIPKIEKQKEYSIKAKDIKNALEETLFSISPTESRVEISGALFSFNYPKTGILTIVGTDSYRLTKKEISFKGVDNKKKDVIVPLKALKEILRIIDVKGDGQIYLSENQILFTYENSKLISRIISGEYPDYQQIIPVKINSRAIIDKNDLLRVVKIAGFFTQTNINDVKLKLISNKNQLIISSCNDKIGSNESEIKADISGENVEIIFNYNYLIDGINKINSKEVILEVVNNTSPVIIKSKEDVSYLYLIMPIQI